MIHTSLPRNCVVFLLLCELTRSAIYKFYSHKWPAVLVNEVKGKPCNLEACFLWINVFYFYNIFPTYAFNKKRLQTLFKDQLDRSKATSSFNCKMMFQTSRNPHQTYLNGSWLSFPKLAFWRKYFCCKSSERRFGFSSRAVRWIVEHQLMPASFSWQNYFARV